MARRGPRLKDIRDVSKFLGRVIRQVYLGQLDPGLGGRLGYLCNIMKSCLEASDLEKRVEEIEAAVQEASETDLRGT